jgi:exosortase family protein XrtF
MLKEFKPAFIFLGKFLGLYLVGNLLYGLYINSFDPVADPATRAITVQTSACINIIGGSTTFEQVNGKPSIALMEEGSTILNVFEGCNGINVMIIFVAFVIAFGGPGKAMLWFIPLGLLVIHVMNILRIGLLYIVAKHYSHYFYYVHKYFFTAILYFVIFILWTIWVMKFNGTGKDTPAETTV